jgi:hypothetical protein
MEKPPFCNFIFATYFETEKATKKAHFIGGLWRVSKTVVYATLRKVVLSFPQENDLTPMEIGQQVGLTWLDS